MQILLSNFAGESLAYLDDDQDAVSAFLAETKSDEVKPQHSVPNPDLESADFDRLLEAASSGGMSNIQESEGGGALKGVDIQRSTRRQNSTLDADSTAGSKLASGNGLETLTETLQQLRRTSQARASAKNAVGKTPAKDLSWDQLKPQVAEPDTQQEFLDGSMNADNSLLGQGISDNDRLQQMDDSIRDSTQHISPLFQGMCCFCSMMSGFLLLVAVDEFGPEKAYIDNLQMISKVGCNI